MYVYDQNRVIVQQINGEGKAFADTFATQVLAQGTTCTDAAFYRDAFRLFVGCYSQDSAYIYTLDPNTAEIKYTLTIPNHGIKNRLRMFITNFSKKASDPYYLVVYDQIFDNSAPFGTNLFAHVIKNVDQRMPTFYNTAAITGLANYQLADIFPYNDYLISVGRRDSSSAKSLTQCNYDLIKTFSCSTSSQKSTPVTQGIVGLDQRYGRYYEVNQVQKSIKVTGLSGDFVDPNWNKAIIKQVSNVEFSSKGIMRDFTESDYNISINHTSA